MMIILVFTCFIVLLLFAPIGIRIIYDDKFTDIDIFAFKLIKYKFDVDNFIRKFIIDNNGIKKINVQSVIDNLEILLNSKDIIKDICKKTKIKKSTIVIKQDYDNYLLFITNWNIISRYAYIIRKSFKKIENEYYMLSNSKNDISIEIIFQFQLINLVIVLIKNFKELIKILKIKRRQRKNGTSNL